MGYSRESPWHWMDQMEHSAYTMEYFKPQVHDDYQMFHFRWYKNDNSRMCHRYWEISRCSSLFPRTFRLFMSIRTLSQKIGTLRSCLPYAFKKRDRLKAANGGEPVFHVQQKNKNYQNNKKLFPPSTNQKEYDKCVMIRWWLYWLSFWWWQVCYICFHCLRIRMPPHLRMLLRNANELMQSHQNYGTVV